MDAQSNREELREHAAAIPLIEKDSERLLSETESTAFEFDLDALRSHAMRRIRFTARIVYSEIVSDLPHADDPQHFIITTEQLKGAIYKATRRGATQALYDSGGILKESRAVEEMLLVDGSEPELPTEQ